MSFPTTPAFVHHGGWGDETRSHPAMMWMEAYTAAADDKAWTKDPYSKWMTSDHVLQRSTSEKVSGGEASWALLGKEIYAPFASHLHYPEFAIAWEAEGGYELIGSATMYYNLVAPGDGAKIQGKDGNQWTDKAPVHSTSNW